MRKPVLDLLQSRLPKEAFFTCNVLLCCFHRNEKTGIPLEFLQVLDVCVEIPQCGLIRSLNVHVTGAICVWEYHKQWSHILAE